MYRAALIIPVPEANKEVYKQWAVNSQLQVTR